MSRVENKFLPSFVGTVARILLVALLAGCASFAQAQAVRLSPEQTPIPDTYFGMHIHRAYSTTPWPGTRFGALRLWDSGTTWAKLEPAKGQWQFEQLDKIVALAEKSGVDVLLTLGSTPRWASARPDEEAIYGKGSAAEPREMRDWENYVRTVAQRYKGRIHNFEIWNEPFFSEMEKRKARFYSGSALQMVELARSARRVLREVDSANKVFTPGFDKDEKRLDYFLGAGGKDVVDGISAHMYTPSSLPEAMLVNIAAIRSVMKKHGVAGMELWCTEKGYEAGWIPEKERFLPPDELLPAYLARSHVLAAAAGLQRMYWYSWDHNKMGLVDSSGKAVNQVGFAYAQTGRWLRGAIVRECRSEDRVVWSCELERDGRRARMAWSTSGTAAWTPPREWDVREYETLDGKLVRSLVWPMRLGPAPLLLKSDAQLWAPKQ